MIVSRAIQATLMTDNYVASFDASGADITSSERTKLTEDELAAIAIICECVRCLCNGQKIMKAKIMDELTNSGKKIEDVRFQFEWLKSGTLKPHGLTQSDWRYCDTLEAAMKENRTFTCPYSVMIDLPSKREPLKKEDTNDEE